MYILYNLLIKAEVVIFANNSVGHQFVECTKQTLVAIE